MARSLCPAHNKGTTKRRFRLVAVMGREETPHRKAASRLQAKLLVPTRKSKTHPVRRLRAATAWIHDHMIFYVQVNDDGENIAPTEAPLDSAWRKVLSESPERQQGQQQLTGTDALVSSLEVELKAARCQVSRSASIHHTDPTSTPICMPTPFSGRRGSGGPETWL